MQTDVKQLIELCREELEIRGYSEDYKCRISKAWDSLMEWMDSSHVAKFDTNVGNAFCNEKVGTHLPNKGLVKSQRVYVRAVRMLISTQKKGSIEDHAPKIEHIFLGPLGNAIKQYLEYMTTVLKRKESTVKGIEYSLYLFYTFLTSHSYEIKDLNFSIIEDFHHEQGYSLNMLHTCARIIRRFLKYLYESDNIGKDYSIYIVLDKYRNTGSKLPSTYTEEEIRKVLLSVDRSSSVGKRDYLILVLASEYGWRNGDIRHFRFDHIDWEKNEIHFSQNKTNVPVSFPLLASVGNAIIDYVKNGRPATDVPEVILSVKPSRKSMPLSAQAVSHIAAKYFGKSGISALNARHRGTHAFRHSLASNMLEKEVPLPVISGVLGHSSTETTKIYLKVDFKQLKKCTLPIPENNSPFYTRGGIWL
ncbi:MAG: site-specific integrase [Fermentimonas sp.]|nr:site-specific integrase [Fermentimonas sp.]